MTKTQKRCLIGSMLLHGTLLASLFVGAAFMKQRPKEDAIIMFAVDPRMIEGVLSRDAGNPNFKELKLPPPSPLPTPVTPAPLPEVKPEPIKETVKEPIKEPDPPKVEPKAAPEPEVAKPEPPKIEPPKIEPPKNDNPDPLSIKKPEKKPEPIKRPVIQINTAKTVKKNPKDTQAETERARNREREAAAATARAKAAAAEKVQMAFRNSISAINTGAATSTQLEVPGLGAEAFASYGTIVYNHFYRAWLTSGIEGADDAITQVEIIVARDGTIPSKRIKKRSGVPALDKSVQNALDRVTNLPSFPEGAKDSQRTFILKFNLKAKSGSL